MSMVNKKKSKKMGLYDPKKKALKVRKKLTDKPRVVTFKDYKGQGLIRVLRRANWTLFPEFALYVKLEGPKHPVHEEHDEMLREAGLTEEQSGKWVLRTNKFNIFVYV